MLFSIRTASRVRSCMKWSDSFVKTICLYPVQDAEPLYRYKLGGYHPVHIGDLIGNGRYEIVHKLGWGAYSTVWAARDTA